MKFAPWIGMLLLAVVLLVGAVLLGRDLFDPEAVAFGTAELRATHVTPAQERGGSVGLGAIDALREHIVEQEGWQTRLQEEVWELSDRMRELDTTLRRLDEQLTMRSDSKTSGGQPPFRQETVKINEERFLAAGFGAVQAAALAKRANESELEKLYLRDQATREGWMGTRRFLQAMAKLDSEVQLIEDELDEESFDRFLYATGQPNRVTVQSIIGGSAAEHVGILAGDVIIRYAGERMYSWRDLRQSSSGGEAGELVVVEVLREGERLQLYISRGPLGVQLEQSSVKP